MPAMPHCRVLDSLRQPSRASRQDAGSSKPGRSTWAVLVLWAVLAASPALGATTPPDSASPALGATAPRADGVQLEFRGAGPCAAPARYQAGVEQRTARVKWQPDATTRVQVEVTEVATPPYAGRLLIQRPEHPTVERQLEAHSCTELLEALALVTALTLEPPVAPESPTRREASEPATSSTAGSTLSWRDAAIGAAGSLLVGGAPGLLPGLALQAQLSWQSRRSGWRYTPALELGAAYHARSGFEARHGRATFSVLSARAALCPLAWGTSQTMLGACGFAESGRVQAAGRATRQPSSATHPWHVLGGSVLLQWNPTVNWRLFARSDLGAPLYRTTYRFEPEQFYETPPWTAAFAVGLAFVGP